MKKSSLLAVVAGALLLGACGMPEEESVAIPSESEEAVTVSPELEVSAQACTTYALGGATTCKPATTLSNDAAIYCSARGKTLSSYTITGLCSGGYRYIKFECC